MAAKEGAINARGDRDTTPLMYASAYGSLDAMKLLLEHNAGVNAASKTGRAPLMIAALHNGSDRVVDLLLAKGANTKAQDNGADVNGKDRTGYTALMNAAMTGDVEPVKLLLSKGAEVNAVSGKEASGKLKNGPIDLGNDSALTLAAIYGPAEIVRLLLNAGADPSAKSLTGETAVEWAAEYSVPGVMKLLPAYSGKDMAIENVKAPPDLSVRAAAARSLPLVQNVSNTFMGPGGCVACRAQNLNALAAQYAKVHGFAVDEPGLKNT